ncbi:MAG: MFS transporter, partial [Melioribacteraceae bacterium]|nr:MFS transporter [Melioribacteraceae bacterium]
SNQTVAVISVILIGLGFANIFPIVFSITVDSMPEKSNELSGLMITAIVGGAFIPPIMGFVADSTSVLLGFLVPLVAVIYIAYTAFYNIKKV